jgi:polar amino acid transport system substrate-binding protein
MLPSSLDNEAFGKALDEDFIEFRENGNIEKILKKYGLNGIQIVATGWP